MPCDAERSFPSQVLCEDLQDRTSYFSTIVRRISSHLRGTSSGATPRGAPPRRRGRPCLRADRERRALRGVGSRHRGPRQERLVYARRVATCPSCKTRYSGCTAVPELRPLSPASGYREGGYRGGGSRARRSDAPRCRECAAHLPAWRARRAYAPGVSAAIVVPAIPRPRGPLCRGVGSCSGARPARAPTSRRGPGDEGRRRAQVTATARWSSSRWARS